MSKIEELCKAFTNARKLFNQYEADCTEFAKEIWNRFIQYYEIPLSQVSLHNFDAYGAADKISGFDELEMGLREDGYFEFGIGITLFELPKVFPYPHFTIILPIDISIDKTGQYKAKYGENVKSFVINKNKESDFSNFFDEIFKLLISEYEEGLSNIRLQNTFRKIGFQKQGEE